MICALCQRIYGPQEINGVSQLGTFNGYTVDFRLRQFRKVPRDRAPVFIDFDTPEGSQLQEEMHNAAEATFVWLPD